MKAEMVQEVTITLSKEEFDNVVAIVGIQTVKGLLNGGFGTERASELYAFAADFCESMRRVALK